MRVAVLLCGHLRDWRNNRDDFIRFMDGVDYDLYIHTYFKNKDFHPYIQGCYQVKDNDGVWTREQIEQELALSWKALEIEDEITVDQPDVPWFQHPDYPPNHDLQVLKGKGISIRTFLSYRKVATCLALVEGDYDYIVKTRPDIGYGNSRLKDLLLPLDDSTLAVLTHGIHPCDQFFLARPEAMRKVARGVMTVSMPNDREYTPHEFLWFIVITHCQMKFLRFPSSLAIGLNRNEKPPS